MADQEEASSIREVLEEAAGKSDAAPTEPPTEEAEGKPASSSSPTPTGDGKSEESLEPIDKSLREKLDAPLAKLSEEDRTEVLKHLRNYDRHFHKGMQGIAEFRRFADGLVRKFPDVTASEIEEALTEKRGKPSTSKSSDNETTTEEDIDALINKADDPRVREELRKSKAVLHREMDKRLAEKLKPIQDELNQLRQTTISSRALTVDKEIDDLEDVDGFPSSFIEKHREAIRIQALKWNLPAKEVLGKVVPFAELSEAFAALKKSSPKTSEASKTSPARTVSGTFTSKESLDKFREPKGGWDIRRALSSLGRVKS